MSRESNLDNEEIMVFVYGTLMKGKSNHQSFLTDAKFIGDFTAKDFALYDLGDYPGIIDCKGERVKGEVYAIDSHMLNRLDMLEEEGELYIRKLIEVADCNNETQEAYTYVYNHDISDNIKVDFENQPWGAI